MFEERNWLYSGFLRASTTLMFVLRGGGVFEGAFCARVRGVFVVASDEEKDTRAVVPGVPVERCGFGALNPNDTCRRTYKLIVHCAGQN